MIINWKDRIDEEEVGRHGILVQPTVQNAIFFQNTSVFGSLDKKKRGNAHRRLPGIGPGGRWLDTTSRVNC